MISLIVTVPGIAISASGTICLFSVTSRSDVRITVRTAVYKLDAILFLIFAGCVAVICSSKCSRIFRLQIALCICILKKLFLRQRQKLILITGTIFSVFILICKVCILAFPCYIIIFIAVLVILKPAEIFRFKQTAYTGCSGHHGRCYRNRCCYTGCCQMFFASPFSYLLSITPFCITALQSSVEVHQNQLAC